MINYIILYYIIRAILLMNVFWTGPGAPLAQSARERCDMTGGFPPEEPGPSAGQARLSSWDAPSVEASRPPQATCPALAFVARSAPAWCRLVF